MIRVIIARLARFTITSLLSSPRRALITSMSDAPFYMTRMGRTYYEHTLPQLVRELVALNANLERVANALQKDGETDDGEEEAADKAST